jgi:hypothetical protein
MLTITKNPLPRHHGKGYQRGKRRGIRSPRRRPQVEYCRNIFTMADWDDHLEGMCQRDGRQQSNNNFLLKKNCKTQISFFR